MKNPLNFLTAIIAVFCITTASFAAEASPAGIWKWTVQSRQGGQGFEQVLKLDYNDGKVTGTMVGRQGGQFSVPDTEISDASFKEGVLTFSLTREFNGRSFTTKYEGKIEGDTIKGSYERPAFNSATPVKNEWIAKRQK